MASTGGKLTLEMNIWKAATCYLEVVWGVFLEKFVQSSCRYFCEQRNELSKEVTKAEKTLDSCLFCCRLSVFQTFGFDLAHIQCSWSDYISKGFDLVAKEAAFTNIHGEYGLFEGDEDLIYAHYALLDGV